MGASAEKSNRQNDYLRKSVNARMAKIRETLGVPQPPKKAQDTSHNVAPRKRTAA